MNSYKLLIAYLGFLGVFNNFNKVLNTAAKYSIYKKVSSFYIILKNHLMFFMTPVCNYLLTGYINITSKYKFADALSKFVISTLSFILGIISLFIFRWLQLFYMVYRFYCFLNNKSKYTKLVLCLIVLFYLSTYITHVTSIYYSYYIYIYMVTILILFTVLVMGLLSYFFLGYQISFNLYTSIYLVFLPLQIMVLITSLMLDFNIEVSLCMYSSIFQTKFNLIEFVFDDISTVFSTSTFVIGFFTGTFQYLYMSDDLKKDRFFFFLNYFIFSMVLFVHSSNYIMILLGWEMLGITSFFLIVHYDLRYLTVKAALKAFSFNRLSDVFLLLVIVIQYTKNGSFYIGSGGITESYFTNLCFMSVLLLILASFIKSAQLFFFFWLPDSMEAPIPASALIHSATLVSAGVYLMIRIRYDLLMWPILCNFILIVSSLTIFIFTPLIVFQTDLKRLLALSTIVNISFLYIMVVLLNSKYVCYYFIVHGFFKSCSFLLLGFFITLNKHSQDYRSFNLVISNVVYIGFLLGISVIFLSGFNLTFVYNIKHIIDGRSYFLTTYGYLFDILFIHYSLFSTYYGLKVLYYVYMRSTVNSKQTTGLLNKENYLCLFYINNIISLYLLMSIVFSLFVYLCIFDMPIISTEDLEFINTYIRPNIRYSYATPLILIPVYTLLNDNKYTHINTLVTLIVMVWCIL